MPDILLIQPNKELFIIGVIYTILSVIVFPVYAVIIHALLSRNDLRENTSYKLINLMNVCDVAQAICHFLTGVFLIFPEFSSQCNFFVRIVGCTANSLWLATFVIMAILACARISIAFFSTKHTKWTLWMKLSLGIGSIYILFVWLAGCVTQNFMLDGPNWAYDMRVPFAELFAQLELVLCFPTLFWSFCSYVLIIYNIYKKKRQAQSSSSLRVEIGILIQATILTAYMAILITLWHNADLWFRMTNITLATLNSVWILFSHVNAILLIVTNSGVRREILKNMGMERYLPKRQSRLTPLSHGSSFVGN